MNKIYTLLLFFICLNVFSQVGINTDNPKSTLDINGNLSFLAKYIEGNNTGSSGDPIYLNDGTELSIYPKTNDDKFELPDASLYPGRLYIIRNVHDTNRAILQAMSGQQLYAKDTANSSNSIVLDEYYNNKLKTIIIISDGYNWTYFF